jgi:ABC-type multidrug transport system fused ATPase/permease subunit
MENLPIPKSRQGWLSVLILTILAFVIYYFCIYPQVDQGYRAQFYPRTYKFTLPYDCEITDQTFCGTNLYIFINIPEFILGSGPVWAYVTVDNRSTYTLADVIIHLDTLNRQTEPSKNFLLFPKMSTSELNEQTLKATRIYPGTVISGRMQLMAQGQTNLGNVSLEIGELISDEGIVGRQQIKAVSSTTDTVPLKPNTNESLRHAVFENLLLPPWSNGILLGMVIFAAFLADHKGNKDNKFTWLSFWKHLALASLVLVILASLIFIFVLLGSVILLIIGGLLILIAIVVSIMPRKGKERINRSMNTVRERVKSMFKKKPK